MAGDHVVRSLLEKMSQCASQSYLGILERYDCSSYEFPQNLRGIITTEIKCLHQFGSCSLVMS